MVSARSRQAPVADDEYLLRILVSPRDATDTSPPRFEQNAILHVVSSGLSVLREAMATPDEIQRLAQSLVDGSARNVPVSQRVTVAGVLRFRADLVRSRRFPAGSDNSDKPKYCVYETPEAHYPSHADVLITAARFPSNNKRKGDAFELFAALQPHFVPAAAFAAANLATIVRMGEKAA
jgi:hypothetical protein